jgi:putative colanic acid biosynthesis glycosyltransferase WcaI
MRILFVTPYFPPEVGAPQVRIYELALRLKRLGHEVSVLTTFPNYPTGIVPPEWRGKLFWKGEDAGMHIYRVWTYATRNAGFYKRVLGQLSFALCTSLAAPALPPVDAIIVESPPLFDGFAGLALSWAKQAPSLFMVSDLWPDSAVQMGMLRNRSLIWSAKQMERLFYRRSAAVLALTAGIQRSIQAEGIAAEKVVLFRNSVDCEFFRPLEGANALRAELGYDKQDFLAVYAGTFGLAHNLSTVLSAAAQLQQQPGCRARFLLAGDGAESPALRAKAAELGLRNLKIIDPLPKSRMPELLNVADCVLVPLRDLEIFRGALPTKMFEAMACAKPVVLGIRGEAADLMRQADAGLCIMPEDPAEICAAVLQLMDDRGAARCMGLRGRSYVAHHFARESRARQLSDLLETLVSQSAPAAQERAESQQVG